VSRPRFLFVSGTDTDVGKTTVARALLAAWRARELRVLPLKPIETGCGEALLAADATQLALAAGSPPATACILRYALPLSPEAAARATGAAIDPQALIESCLALGRAAAAEQILVEGAGGLLVPIAPGYTMADLAGDLGARVLLVARTRLGTLNHCLLSLAECRRRGLPVIGVVLNRTDAIRGPEDADNAALLRAHGRVEVLGPLPYVPAASLADLQAAAQAHLPIARLHELAFGDERGDPRP
jgi:dethiobiotin synthetase